MNNHAFKADGWGITGSFETSPTGTRIRWTNGVVWERPALEGSWFVNDDKVASVRFNGNWFGIVDQNGQETSGTLVNNHTVRADGWGITGSFETSATGTRIRWTNGAVWERPALEGAWFTGGNQSTRIRFNGNWFGIIDSNGQETSGTLLNNHTIRADGWGITGSFETSPTGTRIRWTNGVIWERPAVEGRWFAGDGKSVSVTFNGNWYGLVDQNGRETSGTLLSDNTIRADGWGITGKLASSSSEVRILWSDSTAWVRPTFEGNWFTGDGKVASIRFNGNWFGIVDNNGQETSGQLLSSNQIKADGWGTTGTLASSATGTQILWSNGVVWERPVIEGNWFVGGDRVASIRFNGNWFGIVDENGRETSGRLLTNKTLQADGWGITGVISSDENGVWIRWSNLVNWERLQGQIHSKIGLDASGKLSVVGTSGKDMLLFKQIGSSIYLNGQRINGSVKSLSIKGLEGHDTISLDSLANGGDQVISVPATIQGGEGDDTITGGSGSDIILGNSGRDYIYGKAGNDSLSGGPDLDYLFGESGADRFLILADDNMPDFAASDAKLTFLNGETPWTENEVLLLDVGFGKLQDRTGNTRLLRLPSGGELQFIRNIVRKDIPAALADNDSKGHINVYNGTFTADANFDFPWTIVMHEIGHNWDSWNNNSYGNENPQADAFAALSGWVENPALTTGLTQGRDNDSTALGNQNKWWYTTGSTFNSDYGTTDRYEDFCEALVATFITNSRYNNGSFQNPAKIAWMNSWLDSI